MKICAIDPGTTESAFVVWETLTESVIDSGFVPNPVMRDFLQLRFDVQTAATVAIEMIASYGMPVGKETFETCVWIGRFLEVAGESRTRLVYRKDVKMHLCQSMRAKDGNIRQSLIDKHGPVGTKKNPGKLYGVSGHLWAALAVADYVASNPL